MPDTNNDEVVDTVNTAPTISGVASATITVGDSYNPLSGVTATDTEDGDLTSSIEVTGTVDVDTVGTYDLVYSVTDSGDLTTTEEATITVEAANTAPTISGVADKSIPYGSEFDSLEGVTATDTEDGDLTSSIEVSGDTVDTSTPGEYGITYSVTDSGDLTTTANCTITVLEEVEVPLNVVVPDVADGTNNQLHVKSAYLKFVEEADYVLEESDDGDFLVTKKPSESNLEVVADPWGFIENTTKSVLLIRATGTFNRYN